MASRRRWSCSTIGSTRSKRTPTCVTSWVTSGRADPEGARDVASSVEAWTGDSRPDRTAGMSGMVTGLGRQRGLEMFARWTDRIAAGEVPPAPPRPRAASATLCRRCGTRAARLRRARRTHSSTSATRLPTLTGRSNASIGATTASYRLSAGADGAGAADHRADPRRRRARPVDAVPSPYWGEKLYWCDPAITDDAAIDVKAACRCRRGPA